MSQDELINILLRYPDGITRAEWKKELNLKWIGTDQIRSLVYKKIIVVTNISKRGVKKYRLIGIPEKKCII